MLPDEIWHFPFLILNYITVDRLLLVEICHSYSVDVLKSLTNSAMELFMDVNDTELFEESIRKEREETELRKKKGEQVRMFRYWWEILIVDILIYISGMSIY